MTKVHAPFLHLLMFATVFTALPTKAAARPLPAAAQDECAALNPSKGEEKFAGQISGGPTGSLIEVTYGDQTVLVRYSNSVPVCEGGRPASVNALALGASVVVYGPMKRKGKTEEMNATKILVAGKPQEGMRSSEPVLSNQRVGSPQGSGSITAKDDWESPGPGPSNPQNPGAISCSALVFSVNPPREGGASGQATGRTSVSGITCRKPVDQLAMQLAHDALTNHRLSTVALNWQNQLEITLSDAEIMSVLFTSDNGTQVVEVSFGYQKAEIVYLPSGARIIF